MISLALPALSCNGFFAIRSAGYHMTAIFQVFSLRYPGAGGV